MRRVLEIEAFLLAARGLPVVDVRSPGEFASGHITGAVNVPLFTDAERAEVGTAYVQQSREVAVDRGLEIVGPKMAGLAREMRQLVGANGELLMHCWRGGMRSGSMAWLAETVGLKVSVLEGGYKVYRRWVLQQFETARPVRVVAGLTGSGKSVILRALRERGEAVLDLEKLAHHKGSAFGSLGEAPQPTQEQFENDLSAEWSALAEGAVVWMEDESRNIGRCLVPEGLWRSKQAGVFEVIELPEEERVRHLCDVYASYEPEGLKASINVIGKRLGGVRHAEALAAVDAGQWARVCGLVLGYYDRTYARSVEQVPAERLRRHSFEKLEPSAIAEALCQTPLLQPSA
jgi:tRNA 2-selenouridine synthase